MNIAANTNDWTCTLRGNLEALEQGLALLCSLSDDQYVQVLTPNIQSSIGQHLRHVIDNYLSIVRALEGKTENTVIDYDFRRRGAEVETSRAVAIDELNGIVSFVNNLDLEVLGRNCTVSTEVMLSSCQPVKTASNIGRELIFAGSHAVHHFAIIGIIAKLLGVAIAEPFGIAPATASYLREQAS